MVERERVSICTMFALFVALYILQTWAKLSVKGTFSTYHCKPSSCSPGQCTSFPVLGNFPVSPRRTKNISDYRGKGYMSSSSTMIMIETLVGRSGVRLICLSPFDQARSRAGFFLGCHSTRTTCRLSFIDYLNIL
jgi:hypothetical protein